MEKILLPNVSIDLVEENNMFVFYGTSEIINKGKRTVLLTVAKPLLLCCPENRQAVKNVLMALIKGFVESTLKDALGEVTAEVNIEKDQVQ